VPLLVAKPLAKLQRLLLLRNIYQQMWISCHVTHSMVQMLILEDNHW
jgi:hypothetical protein